MKRLFDHQNDFLSFNAYKKYVGKLQNNKFTSYQCTK